MARKRALPLLLTIFLGVFLISGLVLAADATSTDATATATTATAKTSPLVPNLSVDIPTVTFSDVIEKDGALHINFLGDYISGLYVYLLDIGVIIAIVMIMIGGLQWTLSGGSIMGDGGKSSATAGKKRISNAITGLVLLICVYMILFIVNPNLVGLKPVTLISISEVELQNATSGEEGGSTSTMSNQECQDIVDQAHAEGECLISQSFASPTGLAPSCNYHFRDSGGDYKKIKNLDFSAGWDLAIKAPFDGTLTYKKRTVTDNRCGNTITLTGTGKASGASISICHVKDFLDETGTVKTSVEQGGYIGHLGGVCCSGEKGPADWRAMKNGWCKDTGTKCTDPYSRESCTCQGIEQSGNTSGPHVHTTWNNSGGNLLTCLEE